MKPASRVSSPRALSGFLLLPVILPALFFATPPANVTAEAASLAAFTSVEAAAYLETAPGGSADAPVPLPAAFPLAPNWAALLSAIERAGRYVALDLSASTISGMTGTAGEFDPGAANTGERLIVSLVLPDGATGVKAGNSVNRAAFRNFTALKSVAGAGVTSVGDWVFRNCTGLASVSFPEATSIGNSAFGGCTGLASVSFPEATSIGESAFAICISLTTADFPEAASVGNWAFRSSSGLTTADIPKAASIGDGAFFGCTGLASVSFPEAASIGDLAFARCTGLTTVSLPEAQSIGGGAFSGCTGLTTASFPEATSIGFYAFQGCTGLETVSLLEATSIGAFAFSGCAGLTSVSLPEAQSIGGGAFWGCTKLSAASFPKAMEIGFGAFEGTGAKALTVTLGRTVPALGREMFSGVTSTKTVTVRVPSGVAAWTGKIGGFTGYDSTANWGNGFRGGGWNAGMTDSGSINSNIHLTVTTY